eukprot:2839963-Amphidinium_carterae.1
MEWPLVSRMNGHGLPLFIAGVAMDRSAIFVCWLTGLDGYPSPTVGVVVTNTLHGQTLITG